MLKWILSLNTTSAIKLTVLEPHSHLLIVFFALWNPPSVSLKPLIYTFTMSLPWEYQEWHTGINMTQDPWQCAKLMRTWAWAECKLDLPRRGDNAQTRRNSNRYTGDKLAYPISHVSLKTTQLHSPPSWGACTLFKASGFSIHLGKVEFLPFFLRFELKTWTQSFAAPLEALAKNDQGRQTAWMLLLQNRPGSVPQGSHQEKT